MDDKRRPYAPARFTQQTLTRGHILSLVSATGQPVTRDLTAEKQDRIATCALRRSIKLAIRMDAISLTSTAIVIGA